MINSESEPKLILPKSFDEDIRRRLSPEGLSQFVDSLDSASDSELDLDLLRYHREDLPQRLASHWSSAEVSYLLYGQSTPRGLVCSNYYFQDYNLSHYLDMNDPTQANRDDICPDDREVAPHIHSFMKNPENNPYPTEQFLGWVHNHPMGFYFQKRKKTAESVGFSEPDWEWIEWYTKEYGSDGRKLGFAIYYSSPRTDFYKGLVVNQTVAPVHAEVIIE